MVGSRRQIYSLLPLTTRPFHHVNGITVIILSIYFLLTGAGKGIRTSDLLITSQLLYRLSYTGFNKLDILHCVIHSVKHPCLCYFFRSFQLCGMSFLQPVLSVNKP